MTTDIHELRQGRPFAPNGPTGAAGAANRSTNSSPIFAWFDQLFAEQERRHAWLGRAAEQIRQWREKDRLNGQPWGDDISPERGPGRANNAPGDIR